tara:strand:+ start:1833 stop:2312 length:480 start_codon:yes stop_codon:yes gene_type:complete
MDRTILRDIGSIYRATNSFTDYIVKMINLEKGQYQFLVRIKENPNSNQELISSLLQVDKATTTKAIRKLIDKGYVKKTKSVIDKRNFELQLTELGSETCEFLDKEENFCVQNVLNGFNKEERIQANILLNKMKENISTLWQDIRNDKTDFYLEKIKNDY